MAVTELPMFPLGTVLFPSMVLPLHVFEARYRALVRTCLDGSGDFGVVLIERGSEVGGDDVRTDIGTVAHIIQAEELDDGRWVLAALGTRRLRVRAWLPDHPFPRATVEDWPDALPVADLGGAYESDRALLRRVLALKAELDEPAASPLTELADETELGSYQLAALAPLGPADQQRALGAPSTEDRLALIGRLLSEEVDFLERRIGLG